MDPALIAYLRWAARSPAASSLGIREKPLTTHQIHTLVQLAFMAGWRDAEAHHAKGVPDAIDES